MSRSTLKNRPDSRFTPHSTFSPARQAQRGIFIVSFIIIVAIIGGLVALVLYLMKQDRIITSKFEGKRWNIPAKVFSQPLTLQQGTEVPAGNIDNWMIWLNYRNTNDIQNSGTYNKVTNKLGTTYTIHSRQFTYTDSDVEPKQILKVTIKDGKIDKLQSTEPNAKGMVRLEPILIGGIYPDNNEDRIILNINEVPQPLIDALIATEDRAFYEHHGISVRGIVRAIISNITGGARQGGSTITQQLIKNFYLNSERTLERKANEAIMAVLLEMHYSKDEILQTYLNEINLGQDGNLSINGFGLASQFYYNRPLGELRLDQMALLVGLAKGPSQYNPFRNPKAALERRNVVLDNMLTQGKITQAQYNTAIAQPLDVAKTATISQSKFPDFLDVVKRELNRYYKTDDLKNEGMRVYTTLDPNIQLLANTAVTQSVTALKKTDPKQLSALQSALVTANPQNGELLATVGSVSDFTGFNRAVDAKRSVGSLLKPIIYLTAFERGDYNLASGVDDSPISVNLGNGETWTPNNYDRVSHGNAVPLIHALANSYNLAAVHTGMEVGVPRVISQLQKMGIKDQLPNYPATLLGAVSLSPMDMLGVYQVLATGGYKNTIHSIRTVVDSEAHQVQSNAPQNEQVADPAASFMTNYALQKVITDGTAKAALSLGTNLNLAGKTGTTNDYRDAWFAGYSGNYVSVVWVGRDDNQPIGLSGGNGALPMWMNFMRRLDLTPVNLAPPTNVEWQWLENGTGKLTEERCPNAVNLPIATNHIPNDSSDCAMNIYQNEQDRQIAEQRAKDEAEYRAGQQNRMDSIVKDTQSYEEQMQQTIPRPRQSSVPTSATQGQSQGEPLHPARRSESWLQKTMKDLL